MTAKTKIIPTERGAVLNAWLVISGWRTGAVKHQTDVAKIALGASVPVSVQVISAEQFCGTESCLGHAKHVVIPINPTVVCLGS